MKHLTILLSATALAALSLTACSADDLAGSSADTRPVTFTVTLTKGDAPTRSYLNEEGGDLACYWQASDKILVTSPDGSRVGVLTLPANFEEAQTATFSSILDISGNPSQLNLIYYGNKPDLSIVNDSYSRSFASQDGTLASLSNYDFFSNTVDVTMSGNQAMAESTILERHTAFGRFRFTLNGERLTTKDLSVSVSGSNLATTAAINYKREVKFSDTGKSIVTKTNDNGEVWLTILPNEDADGKTNTTLVFDVEISGKTYEGVLDATHSWEAGQYVREVNETDYVYEGVEVALKEKEAENPGGEYGETDPNYADYAGEDTRNPLHKFAKYNLVRVGERGSLVNGFADSETENGALYQWGRNYGYMDDACSFSRTEAGKDYINWMDAYGYVERPDGYGTQGYADFYAYYPTGELVYPCSGGYLIDPANIGMYITVVDQAKSYNSLQTLIDHPDKFFMNAGMTSLVSAGLGYFKWYDTEKDYWLSSFGDGGTTWSERAEKCKYTDATPCPKGWKLPSYDDFKAITPETAINSNRNNLSTSLRNYSELRHDKTTNIDYAIRWKYENNALTIQALIVPETFTKTQLRSLQWEKEEGVVTRIFPFTGAITTIGGLDGLDNEYVGFPYHRGVPDMDSSADCLTVGPGSNINNAFGGYWIDEIGNYFRFLAGERIGYSQAQLYIDTEGSPSWGYAIRPVMDK